MLKVKRPQGPPALTKAGPGGPGGLQLGAVHLVCNPPYTCCYCKWGTDQLDVVEGLKGDAEHPSSTLNKPFECFDV